MNIANLWAIIQALGVKLPQAWPHLIHAAGDIKKVVDIITDGAPPVFLATAESAKVQQAIIDAGIDETEATEVVQAFAALDAAGK